jgi:tRNA(Arg) A34 adenosine deaminase TadA
VESGVRFFSQPTCHHAPDVYSGLAESESAEILRQFFREKRLDD